MLPAAAGVLVVVAVVVIVVVVVAGVVLVVLILVLLYDVVDVLSPSLIWHSFISKSIRKVVGSPHSQKAW